jgi:DNA helicase-2/ATP-dependent DNA helicase PcrA
VRHYADLHIHSKYSRACSRDCDLEHLSWWARRKGVTVLGTGDFTHPAWSEHIREQLVPAEPGYFRLRPDVDREVLRTLPPTCHGEVRFVLQVEISTIYKRDGHTRKVHHLCFVPDLAAAEEFTRKLGKIGNLHSDGRPILGLDSRDLLEITLESGPGAFLIPAHAWTPWFAVLGSKSGFDAVDDCYADLAEHVFAVETGLSSDPAMNWRVSGLDRFRLVSNSDAHSPPALARNATTLDTEFGFAALRRALETGDGYVGTVDMFPDEGKYHLDGHRKCGVRLEPAESRARGDLCPECGKPLTVGVLHRIEELADREPGIRPATAGEFRSIVPLPEILGELLGVGPKSKAVGRAVDELVATLGPELDILLRLPIDELRRARDPRLVEAITRLRAGQVHREGGYDGEYGVISVFAPGELAGGGHGEAGLFELESPAPATTAKPAKAPATTPTTPPGSEPLTEPESLTEPVAAQAEESSLGEKSLLDELDPDQRAAAEVTAGPLLIVAGPGTGKTRTLTHRLAALIRERGVPAERCLAVTFTRRACEEMHERLAVLVGESAAARITVVTFHQLGLTILRDRPAEVGLTAGFAVADEKTRSAVLRELVGERPGRELRGLLAEISVAKRTAAARHAAGEGAEPHDLADRYDKALRSRNLVDFDDLIALPVTLLADAPPLVEHYRARFGWVCVDEYQDVDELQYRLLRQLCPADGNLCAIGDPDQAIYAFRGADVGFFLRFRQDFPGARVVSLTRNYRSSPVIVAGAVAAIAPSTLVEDRALHAMREPGESAERITLYPAAGEDAEAEFVVRTIEELLGGSSFHAHDSGRVSGSDGLRGGLSFDDIAILYRAGAQARPIMEVLAREGLPYQKRSHDRLRDHPGVRAVLDRLSIVDDAATPALVRAAADRALAELGVDPLAEDLSPADAVREALDLLAPVAGRHATDPHAFLAELSLGSEVDTWDPRANRISLLTLHAAKGLEFPVVFIVGCADGMLPLRWPGATDAADTAEERRLFFVGVSRAQSHLYLSYPARRGTVELRPSPFLDALDEDLLHRRTRTERTARRTQQLRLL